MAIPQTRTATPSNGNTKPKKEQKPLTITGYVIAVLKMRETAAPREAKLLQRVAEEHREAAKLQLAKMDRQ